MAAIPGAFHTQALVTDVTPEPVCPCDAACPTRWSEDSRRVWGHRPSPPGSSVLCLESRLIVAWCKHSHTLLPAPLFSTKRVLRVVHTPRFRPEATAGPQPRAGGSSRRRGLQSGHQQTSSQHSYTPNACLKSGLSEHPAGLVTRGSVGLWPGPRAWAHALPASLCPWVLEGSCRPRAPLLGALCRPAFQVVTPRPVPPGARGSPGPSLAPCGLAGDAAAARAASRADTPASGLRRLLILRY